MIIIALKASREVRKVEIEGGLDEDIKLISVPLSILFIVGGAAAIAVGARARPDSNVAAATSPPATARTDCADTWKLIVLLIE